jgi:acid phosphatase (class A)
MTCHPRRLSKGLPVLCLMVVAAWLGGTMPLPAKDLLYLAPNQVDLMALLPPPPAETSATEVEELAELHRIEASRSKDDEARAVADDAEENVFLYRSVLGNDFTAEKLPVTAALFDQVRNDTGVVSKSAKQAWHRRRPLQVDPSLHPVGKGTSESYPSGHSTLGFADGVILASLIPEKRDEILSRAADYAHNRLICGVHFRSDTVAGQVAGTVIAEALLRSPQFQEKLAAAREELRQAKLV